MSSQHDEHDEHDVYTHGHHDAVLRSHRWRTAQNSAAYLLPELRPGQRLLDVGCGPGTLTADLARLVAPGQVVGIDVAAAVLDEARDHAAAAGVGNVSFQAGDFRTADLAPASFDVVHAHQVLQHLRDPVGALAAMARLVRPGGVVAVRDGDYASMTWSPDDAGLDRWLELYSAVTHRNGGEPNAGRHLLSWAHRAGLADATYTTSTWTYVSPADRSWWAELWADRVTSSTFGEQAVGYGLATPADLADIAAAWRAWAAADDGLFVVLHGEVVARV
jgi:2-polyprenyl-3-methyl-5-hydroxy-6-metoxy-1,4-benzoquinol methylase